MNLSPAKDLDPPSPRRADQCSIASTSAAAAATTKMIRTCLSLLLIAAAAATATAAEIMLLLPLSASAAAAPRRFQILRGLATVGSPFPWLKICGVTVVHDVGFPLQYRHTCCCTTHVYQVPLAPPSLFPLLWLKSCCSAACCFEYGYHGGCRH